ncbi:hypothetical protein COOONC_22721 [Cooperia oncophora]
MPIPHIKKLLQGLTTFIQIPDHYGQDHSERGASQHEELDQSRADGNTAGTDHGGYGDYGSYVHNGWRSYAKGKEHVSYYENDNDDGRHGEVTQDCGHNCYGDDQGQEHHGYGKEFARHDFEENGHGSHYHHDFDPHHNYGEASERWF